MLQEKLNAYVFIVEIFEQVFITEINDCKSALTEQGFYCVAK